MCNLVPEWYTVHCEIQAFIKLAGCECVALMLTWQYVQEIFLGCETRVSTKKAYIECLQRGYIQHSNHNTEIKII